LHGSILKNGLKASQHFLDQIVGNILNKAAVPGAHIDGARLVAQDDTLRFSACAHQRYRETGTA
jgi:hypothetical protein